ncbi:hypothetical protein [Haloflavibacter putidus]|uniref:Uncharacterized protein n=1 Tax=Haloflavibacter putidus TaxID=2576776 RepID=A0A507ZWW8_9FLAO|nr:hypothetical protein [Haloflavibacter putidus]TQD40764.1 hypothetical protein FKR84_01930 [Haloflavibacter putidus]
MAFMLVYMLFREPKKLIWLAAISFVFLLGQYFLNNSFSYFSIVGFGRYFFFLSMMLFFHPLIQSGKQEQEKVFGWWEKLLWLNNTIILIGLLFGLEIFRSYGGERWGYNGLLMASANSTYFYIAALIYFLIRYKKDYFKKSLFWFTLIASICTGTKSVYLGILLLGLIGLFHLNLRKKTKSVLLAGVVLLGFISMYILFTSKLFTRIVREDGWLSAILSYRDTKFTQETIPYVHENWHTIHYLIGGLSNPFIRPQMELIDLFLYFGVLGSALFLYIFAQFYFDLFLSNYQKLVLLILLLIPIITGNFFYNASVPIYLIVLKLAIINKTNSKPRILSQKSL